MIDILVGDPLPRSAGGQEEVCPQWNRDREPGAQRQGGLSPSGGTEGSRGRGGPPGAGPAGTSDADDSTGIDPQEPIAVADLDLDAGAVIAQAQLDGSAAVDHGIGHQSLASRTTRSSSSAGHAAALETMNRRANPGAVLRRAAAVDRRVRVPNAVHELRRAKRRVLDCHVDLADNPTSGPADGVVSGSGSSVRTRPNRTSDFGRRARSGPPCRGAGSAWAYLRCSGRAGAMIVAMGSVALSCGGPRIWHRLVPCRDHKAAVQAQSRASMRSSRCL